MSTVFNTSGGIVSLPATPLNTLNFAIRGSLGQNQITRNIGNFYASWDATMGAVQQQFSIANGTPLVLPSGAAGILVYSNGGTLTLNLSKTTGTVEAPMVANYTVYMEQIYLSDDSLSAVTIENPTVGTTVTGFIAYVPYAFSG
jgi:outer membrane usher protein FimD/PapC